ncbi:hypothetical protein WICPIJ_005951 [Wickerhamomyces pijperi]|uniref:Mannose-P-dolichol utilization defect 1 protein homolog n=1 Tax=Wickerhamomyces pijperi TaxID=599730 RepID=A0A9P8Q307_WICPI|nr:hypothetical protein WICPIJ_005951 [Wickerhamomyces pijperi]
MAQHIQSVLTQLEPYLTPVLTQLRPITKTQLPTQLITWGRELYTTEVFDAIVIQLDLFNPQNSKLVELFIAKTLSLGILGAAGAVKLPQILAILRSGSADGLSFVSTLLDTISYLITVAYNFRSGNDFITFGETAFVSVQNVIILCMILWYTGKTRYINGFIGLIACFAYLLMGNPANEFVFSNYQISQLVQAVVPLSIFAKLPQIISNFKNQSTGALSITSIGAGLLGTFARLATLLSQGVSDQVILIGCAVSIALNSIIFLQIAIFGNKAAKAEKAEKKNK